ncbi:MAG: hypothetical protein Q8L55_09695 [Phycisphaerales bacterium]|nr:hypothetical protein [Phycisphaerales bacterium]
MQTLTILPSDERRWYFSRERRVGGLIPSTAFPGLMQSPIARVVEGKYWTKGSERLRDGPLVVTTGEGQTLFRWDIPEGQQICFANWEHVVGWSEGVGFQTIINTQISSLLLRQFFFFVASGPGTLILEGGGNLQFSGRPDLPRHEFVRYIAWTRRSRFRVEGSSRMRDLFTLMPLTATVTATEGVLLDPDHWRREEPLGLRKLLRWIYRFFP